MNQPDEGKKKMVLVVEIPMLTSLDQIDEIIVSYPVSRSRRLPEWGRVRLNSVERRIVNDYTCRVEEREP